MKPVPLVLLLATVLLTSHIRPSVCRPRDRGMFDGQESQLDEVLQRAGDNAVSYLLGDQILRYLQRNPSRLQGVLPQFTFSDGVMANSLLGRPTGLGHLARSLPPSGEGERAPEEGNSLDELVELTKRNNDPPISIDLTFHLLRNMIEMARIENQKEQALINRKYLDEVGK